MEEAILTGWSESGVLAWELGAESMSRLKLARNVVRNAAHGVHVSQNVQGVSLLQVVCLPAEVLKPGIRSPTARETVEVS